jgi:SAM-dependent methyltransferase
MADIAQRRRAEFGKYERAYKLNARYQMKRARFLDAAHDLARLPGRGAFLDVSCGRGEMLAEAERIGFHYVRGTEIVADLIDGNRVVYGEVHALPFQAGAFNVATM